MQVGRINCYQSGGVETQVTGFNKSEGEKAFALSVKYSGALVRGGTYGVRSTASGQRGVVSPKIEAGPISPLILAAAFY